MTRHHELDEPAREACALAALGLLPPDEAEAFAAHLAECPPCRAEHATLLAAAGALAALAPPADPPEGLRARVLAAVRAEPPLQAESVQPWKAWTAQSPAGLFSLAADAGGWESTGSPGVQARRLFLDAAAGRVTMMVRMEPGSSYPGHRHAGAEECFVVSGDLRTGNVHLRAGDYQRADAGTRHPVQTTDGGCVLLLVSSLDDTLD